MEKNNEAFFEKCDRVLRYLKSRPSEFTEVTTLKKITEDTGINTHDNVLSFLEKEKKYIEYNSYTINITGSGEAFISGSSFHNTQQDADISSSLLWYNHADAKQRFDDYPKVKRQRNNAYMFTAISLFIAIVAVIVSILQIKKT